MMKQRKPEEEKYYFFRLKELVDETRNQYKNEIEELDKKEDKTADDKNNQQIIETAIAELENISDDMIIEDLPFYRDYLKDFDIQHLLKDYELRLIEKMDATPADNDILLRFIFGSPSITYDLVHENVGNQVTLYIESCYQSKRIRIKYESLWHYQIYRLLEIFFSEQIRHEALLKLSAEDKADIDTMRKQRLLLFDKKKQILQDYKESLRVNDALDELLNSNVAAKHEQNDL